MSKESKQKYYGLLLFVGGIILIAFYTAVTFGNYFFPDIVHFELFGVNILNYEFWLLLSVWSIVMLICGLLVWLGFFMLIKPLMDKTEKKSEAK